MPLPIIRFGVKGISSIIEITGNPYDSLAIDRYGAVSGEFPDIDTDSIIDFTSSDQGLYAGLRFSDNKMLTPKPTPSRSVNAGRSLWVRELANLARDIAASFACTLYSSIHGKIRSINLLHCRLRKNK